MNTTLNAFGFLRKSGILMPVSSLPSGYGIGSFGKEAYDFVDFLDKCGQKVWQVLPLNPTSYGDSPYQSPASAAGNPYFIDLEILCEKGLITNEELDGERASASRVDYGRLFNTRYEILRKAYSRFTEDDDYRDFLKKNASWVDDYALFMALKVKNGYAPWTAWAPEHKDSKKARELADEFAPECNFWRWTQYEFLSEWSKLHNYAAGKGILIIGDMPIYVAHDSVDVWRAPEQFLLDDELMPRVVAGCPPDGFTEDGQRWGNPIYDWEKMKDESFSWWVERVGRALELYDLLRIDHFRGFASYYEIPAEYENAKIGEWRPAPGKELFDTIKRVYPNAKIIAEDLGFITDDVIELLEHTGFPGMKVLQFAFYDKDSEYLPRCYTTDNCIVYSSSHDSDCTKTWAQNLDEAARLRFRHEYRKKGKRTMNSAVIDLAMSSKANLAITMMQDYLELTNEEGRVNVPAKADGNWTWTLDPEYNTAALRRRIRGFTERSDRLK